MIIQNFQQQLRYQVIGLSLIMVQQLSYLIFLLTIFKNLIFSHFIAVFIRPLLPCFALQQVEFSYFDLGLQVNFSFTQASFLVFSYFASSFIFLQLFKLYFMYFFMMVYLSILMFILMFFQLDLVLKLFKLFIVLIIYQCFAIIFFLFMLVVEFQLYLQLLTRKQHPVFMPIFVSMSIFGLALKFIFNLLRSFFTHIVAYSCHNPLNYYHCLIVFIYISHFTFQYMFAIYYIYHLFNFSTCIFVHHLYYLHFLFNMYFINLYFCNLYVIYYLFNNFPLLLFYPWLTTYPNQWPSISLKIT